jgi:hypothetical protein
MELVGISWQNEDGCWCLEVDETTYKKVMGAENWYIEKQIRKSCSSNEMPWTIQMDDLLMHKGVMSGNKVRIKMRIERIDEDEQQETEE